MDALWTLVAVAATGVTYDWQPLDDGSVEYVVQVEPELLEAARAGDLPAIESNVPEGIGEVRRVRVVLGGEKPARDLTDEQGRREHSVLKPTPEPVAWPGSGDEPGMQPTSSARRHTVRQSGAFNNQQPLTPYTQGVNNAAGQLEAGFQQASQGLQNGYQQAGQAYNTLTQPLTTQPATDSRRTIGGELLKGVNKLREGTRNVVRNTGEAIEGTAENLGDGLRTVLTGGQQPAAQPAPAGSGAYNPYSYNSGATPGFNGQTLASPNTGAAPQSPLQPSPGQQFQSPGFNSQPTQTPGPGFVNNPGSLAAPPLTASGSNQGQFNTGQYTNGQYNNGQFAQGQTGSFNSGPAFSGAGFNGGAQDGSSPQFSGQPSLSGFEPSYVNNQSGSSQQPNQSSDWATRNLNNPGAGSQQNGFSRTADQLTDDGLLRVRQATTGSGNNSQSGGPLLTNNQFQNGQFQNGQFQNGQTQGGQLQGNQFQNNQFQSGQNPIDNSASPNNEQDGFTPWNATGAQYAAGQTGQQGQFGAPPVNQGGLQQPLGQFAGAGPGLPPLDNPNGLSPVSLGQDTSLGQDQQQGLSTDTARKPWEWLAFASLVSFGSIACNFFLGWSYLDARNKYQSALRRTVRTFSRSDG